MQTESSVAVLNTKPNQDLSLSNTDIFILCEALRASLARLQFQYLCVKNNLLGSGTDQHQARILEQEITEATALLGRLEGTPDKAALETQLEADTEVLERAALISIAYLFTCEREAAG